MEQWPLPQWINDKWLPKDWVNNEAHNFKKFIQFCKIKKTSKMWIIFKDKGLSMTLVMWAFTWYQNSLPIPVFQFSSFPVLFKMIIKMCPELDSGFEPPLIDDTSYEAGALPTKPLWPNGVAHLYNLQQLLGRSSRWNLVLWSFVIMTKVLY